MTDQLSIKWPVSEAGTGELWNVQGQLVNKITLLPGTNRLDVAALATGVYTLRYFYADAWNVMRVMVE